MKKKIIGSFLIIAIAAVAAFNVNLNLERDRDISPIVLANVEALAGENGGSNELSTVSSACQVLIKEIIGYDSDNKPIIVSIPYPGMQGICVGPPGKCSPWPCTKIY
jgi:hypothetical protein